MPLRDGTGPTGEGPKTGRGMGPCAPQAGQDNQPQAPFWRRWFGGGRGQGFGPGTGRGAGRGFGRRS